jgi:hypothetical protein
MIAALSLFLAAPTASGPVTAVINPASVCRDGADGYPNFDLLVSNEGDQEARVVELRGLLLDAGGHLIERRILWQQAMALLGPSGAIASGDTNIIFNPFSFRHLRNGRSLRYEFDIAGTAAPVPVNVPLTSCRPKHPFQLPIAARLLVYDGHDFLSHHRRGQYARGKSPSDLRDNFQRFGIDLVVIDAKGGMFGGDGKKNSDWYGWGKQVRAAAAGTVADLHDGQPDNVVVGTLDRFKRDAQPPDAMASYGNYVLLDHGGGEFSIVGHLQNGSIAVRKGQHVRAGQLVARIGNSGASGGVHTHFERRTGPGIVNMRSLPPYFTGFTFADRGIKVPAQGAVIDTGDVVISNR